MNGSKQNAEAAGSAMRKPKRKKSKEETTTEKPAEKKAEKKEKKPKATKAAKKKCTGTTKDGKPCKRNCLEGKEFCGTHAKAPKSSK